MALEIERKLLDENSALLVDCASQSWIGSRRLIRLWTKIRDRQMEDTIDYLDAYASASNSTATSYVTSPKASHETYDGTWAHQEASLFKDDGVERPDTRTGVQQTLQEVFSVTTYATLAALNRRRTRNDEREREFDFQDGQGEQIGLVFPFLHPGSETACMATITESQLNALAPTGYQFHKRNWAVDTEAHYATLTLEFKKVVWNDWGHSAYAEDYKEYQNAGTNNDEEMLIRTWVNISNATVPTAVADLRDGNRTTPDHSLRSINVNNHRNGACDITIREKKKKDGTDLLYGKDILRPYGWPECRGVRERIWITLEGYETHALLLTAATGFETTPPVGGYVFIKYDDFKDGEGFYGRRYDYEKVEWFNYDPTVFRTVGEQDLEGNGHAQTKQACALPQDEVVAAFQAIAADEGFVLSSRGISVQADGEFSLSGTQTSVYTGTGSGDALWVSEDLSHNFGRENERLRRVWFRRTEAAKDTLIGAGGQAVADVSGYVHIDYAITDHHDGAYTVTQNMRSVWRDWSDDYAHDYLSYSNIGEDNTEEKVSRVWTDIVDTDATTAAAAMRDGSVATLDGFYRIGVSISNRRDGAVDVVSHEKKQQDGTDEFKGKEILRPHGWDECVGIREYIWVLYEGYATQALLDTAVTGAETPPAGYKFVKYEDTRDREGFYGRRYDYEKVTWSNTTPIWKQTAERNSEGIGIGQGKQACALPQADVVAAFSAIASDAAYVLTSKGLSPQANGEYTLSMFQEAVYTGTTAADALVLRISTNRTGSSRALQRVWFRRTEAAKDTLIGSAGEARADYTYDGEDYDHRTADVADHHDGAYTVTQYLAFGDSGGGVSRRTDQPEEYLLKRAKEPGMTQDGSVYVFGYHDRSYYAKLHEQSGTSAAAAATAAEAAWTEASGTGIPTAFASKRKVRAAGSMVFSVPSDVGGGLRDITHEGEVIYVGGGVWRSLRILFDQVIT